MKGKNTQMKKFHVSIGRWDWLLSGIAGGIIFVCIYGLEPLRYSGIDWMTSGFFGTDILQHQSGWMFFRDSAWTYPIGKILNLGIPYGVNIAYLDSIPIVAIFFKIIRNILPETFQYFGWYVFFCFVMQGVSATLLLRLFMKRSWKSVCGSLIFILSPIMIDRAFRHTALSSHYLLLLGLFLYFQMKKKPRAEHLYFQIPLLIVALLTHPYIFAMNVALFVVTWIAACRFSMKNSDSTIRRIIFFAPVFTILSCILVAYITGIVSFDSLIPVGGFGVYSLNVNSLFNPLRKIGETWSVILPTLPNYPENEEGFAYLGIGILVAFATELFYIIFSLIRKRKIIKWRFLYCYAELTVLTIGFVIYALSGTVVLNRSVILTYQVPDFLSFFMNTFRSSGRFIFVPYYCLILGLLVGINRYYKKFAPLCFVLIFLLQVYDFSSVLFAKHQFFSRRIAEDFLPPIWETIKEGQYDILIPEELPDTHLAFWIGRNHLRTNMMISAPIHRSHFWNLTKMECEMLILSMKNGDPLPKSTVVILQNPVLIADIMSAENAWIDWVHTNNIYKNYSIGILD